MLEVLQEHVGKNNFILEKASIDELYLDVTDHCKNLDVEAWKHSELKENFVGLDSNAGKAKDSIISDKMPLLEKKIINETIICAREKISLDPSDRETRILLRGCIIARELRRAVFHCLGFTLSAGICTSKLMSKLAASYGKPNGQAIIIPEAIPHVSSQSMCTHVLVL